MSMFSIFNFSGSAISAQSQRLNVVASNLANVDAVAGPDGKAYKARQVVFQTTPMGADSAAGVRVSSIKESDAPGRKVHDPAHPLADEQGYVRYPDIDMASQMGQLIISQRAYQANAAVVDRAKTSYEAALQIGRS